VSAILATVVDRLRENLAQNEAAER